MVVYINADGLFQWMEPLQIFHCDHKRTTVTHADFKIGFYLEIGQMSQITAELVWILPVPHSASAIRVKCLWEFMKVLVIEA